MRTPFFFKVPYILVKNTLNFEELSFTEDLLCNLQGNISSLKGSKEKMLLKEIYTKFY